MTGDRAVSLREAQLRQEFRAEIMRGYQAALCNSDIPGWTLGDEVAKVADKLLASFEPRPVVDREAVVRTLELYGIGVSALMPDLSRSVIADELMKLARPMPTREAVATALCRQFCEEDPGTDYFDALSEEDQAECVQAMGSFADAVLALLDGTES